MPDVNKVVFDGQTIFDLTSDTVTKEVLTKDITAHGADGSKITGELDISDGIDSASGLMPVTTCKVAGDALVIAVSPWDSYTENYKVVPVITLNNNSVT